MRNSCAITQCLLLQYFRIGLPRTATKDTPIASLQYFLFMTSLSSSIFMTCEKIGKGKVQCSLVSMVIKYIYDSWFTYRNSIHVRYWWVWIVTQRCRWYFWFGGNIYYWGLFLGSYFRAQSLTLWLVVDWNNMIWWSFIINHYVWNVIVINKTWDNKYLCIIILN